MGFCCGGLFKVGNAVRLLHFLITTFIFYVLTASENTGKPTLLGRYILPVYTLPSTDLHAAWLRKNGYFFAVLSLTIVSSFFYLLASLVDPGFLPRSDPTKDIIASFSASTGQVGLVSLHSMQGTKVKSLTLHRMVRTSLL